MANSPRSEIALDEDGLRQLLRRTLPHLAELPLRLVAEGWDNATWRLGEEYAIRLPRRERAAPLITHEQQALPLIAPALSAVGVHTPLPIASGTPDRHFPWPWSLLPWLPGERALDRPVAENRRWADQLARTVLALHIPAPENAPVNPVRGVPLADRDSTLRSRIGRLDSATGDILREIWQQGLDAPTSRERVWIHGDLHPGNILIAEGHLSALIDFGDVTAGDPAYDLAVAWQVFDAAGRERFRATLADRYDDATWMRARAWAAAVAAILLDESDDRDDFRALGRATADELISERPETRAP